MHAPLSELLLRHLKPAIDQREQEQTFSGTVLVSRDAIPLFAGARGYASRTWQIKGTSEQAPRNLLIERVPVIQQRLKVHLEGHLL